MERPDQAPEGIDLAVLGAAVERVAAVGRAAWPNIALATELIAERLEGRCRDDRNARLDGLHDADLYLAIALSHKNSAAVHAFERFLVPEIELALRRMRLPSDGVAEVKQALRFELLVGEDGPKIAHYEGRGELAAWLRVTATRKALKLTKQAAKQEPLDEILLECWPNTTPGPEGRYLRQLYTQELQQAIRETFATLEVRERNLLRQHLFDELTIDDLAQLYRVHRATCARWLVDAREALARGTHKRLVATLGLPAKDLESLLRFLDSDIELSMARVLQTQ